MGRLEQTSLILNDRERQFTNCRQSCTRVYCDKTVKLESHGFCRVADVLPFCEYGKLDDDISRYRLEREFQTMNHDMTMTITCVHDMCHKKAETGINIYYS